MGYHLIPYNESKEDFLKREATPCNAVMPEDNRLALICLVNYGNVPVAIVCCNKEMLSRFNNPLDNKKKIWFTVPKARLYDVVAGLRPDSFR